MYDVIRVKNREMVLETDKRLVEIYDAVNTVTGQELYDEAKTKIEQS